MNRKLSFDSKSVYDHFRVLACQLLDVHPIDQKDLAEKAELAATVISNFRAGRRPIPQHLAAKFFSSIGLATNGELLRDFGFSVRLNSYNAASADAVVSRLFPRGGTFVILKGEYMAHSCLALADGDRYAILHDERNLPIDTEQALPAVEWLTSCCGPWMQSDGSWAPASLTNPAKVPMYSDIAACFADAESFDPEALTDPKWDEVKRWTINRGLTAKKLLEMLKSIPVGEMQEEWP